MKYSTSLFLFLLFFSSGFTQTVKSISLEDCYQKAFEADPLGQKSELLAQSTALQIEKLETDRLPQISWNASAVLQTEVVKFPFEFLQRPFYVFTFFTRNTHHFLSPFF